MISAAFARLSILLLGVIFPAYASFKSIRTKNPQENLKWMMYWIVFALFTGIETLTDVFLSWLPFYYEAKVIAIFWLMFPTAKQSSRLYRRFVHPYLALKEPQIEEYVKHVKEQSCLMLRQLGAQSINYAADCMMNTVLRSCINELNMGRNAALCDSQRSLRRCRSCSDLLDKEYVKSQENLMPRLSPDYAQLFLYNKM